MKHMTPWAAEIDSQSYNNDVLYIQAAGNVSCDVIAAYWQTGYPYPTYLERELCRISDPAQSLQALTVGSVSDSDFETNDIVALGKSNSVSSFSRSGTRNMGCSKARGCGVRGGLMRIIKVVIPLYYRHRRKYALS